MIFLQRAIILVAALTPTYLIRFKIFGIPTTVLECLIALLFLATIINAIRSKDVLSDYKLRLQQIPKSVLLFSGVFFVAGIISVIVAPELRSALGIWRAYVIEAMIFGLIAWLHIRSFVEFRVLAAAFSITAFVVSVYAITQKITGWGIPNPFWRAVETRRVTSFFGYPNAVGLYLELIIPFLVGAFFLTKKIFLRMWFVLVLLLSCAAIIFAESSGTIAALVGTVLIGLFFWKRSRLWTGAIIGLGIMALIFSPLRKPFEDEFLLQGFSGKLRTQMWKETVVMLKTRWFEGAGLAGYQERVAPYHVFKWAEIYLYPHNLLLTLWSEMSALGVVGFFGLFFVMIFVGLRSVLRLTGEGRIWAIVSLSIFSVIFIHGLVDIPYFKNDFSVLYWLLIALTLQIRYNSISTK